MQYLGGKGRLVNQIYDSIDAELDNIDTVVDLFSGSGVISFEGRRRGYRVIGNDFQPYSYSVTKALLSKFNPIEVAELSLNINKYVTKFLLQGTREKYVDCVAIEKAYFRDIFKNENLWEEYRLFVESTELVSGSAESAARARIDDKNSLFLAYYRNTYFGVRQCAEIDALREYANKLDQDLSNLLVAATISAMSYLVNSTAHLAQYLKPNSKFNTLNIIRRKQKSVLESVLNRLSLFCQPMPDSDCEALNEDYQLALTSIDFESSGTTLVYADPPYFKEHYSRYYHVLDTFTLYDFPELTFNPRIGKTTIGRYRKERLISEFGKRATVESAFKTMIENTYHNRAHLVISYADSSILHKEKILRLLEGVGFNVEIKDFLIQHSGQGRARHKDVQEHLFICKHPDIFSQELSRLKPNHDYPAGLIHPYWARKPLNILEAIVKEYSGPGDLVADPFMGSGTTIIAALKNNRRVFGSDLNPLSSLMTKAIVDMGISSKITEELLSDYAVDLKSFALTLYKISNEEAVERERFIVKGEYSRSKFLLELVEQKIKPFKQGKLSGKIRISHNENMQEAVPKKYLNHPINFRKIKFAENTRIAVHLETSARDYFTERNIIFLNYAKSWISNYAITQSQHDVLTLYFSSLIPLLRLSDKKASSQWPYWRPKQNLTSRNPYTIIDKRLKAFLECFIWARNNIKHKASQKSSVKLLNLSVQDIPKSLYKKAALVVTDPPYADHAPYLEYSEMFLAIALDTTSKNLWDKEIVKTNAKVRSIDNLSYELRLKEGLINAARLVKSHGYFVFFYLDKNLDHWRVIKEALAAASMNVVHVIPLKKQRRSMKTVASPGKTLDGDLLIVCQKIRPKYASQAVTLDIILSNLKQKTYFERFAAFIEVFLSRGLVLEDDIRITDLSKVL